MRLTRVANPRFRAAWVNGRRIAVLRPVPLARVLARHAGHAVDLDVEFLRGTRWVAFRIVAMPGRDATMTRLCTNLSRTPFSQDLVSRLYRYRWQIELCFKEGSRMPTSINSTRAIPTSRPG